jgi:hypothetical protein
VKEMGARAPRREERGARPGRGGRRRGLAAGGRALAVLFIAAGIAFLGLLAGGEHRTARARSGGDPMAGYYGEEMPRYPGAEEVPAGPSSRVGGARVRMSYFSTEDSPRKVGRFYADNWRARRLFVREDVTHIGGVVSGIDQANKKVYQVLLAVRGKRTAVFPSVTSTPLSALEPSGEVPPVPLFPGSRATLDLGSDEGENRARVFLSVNDGTLAENEAHYARELRARGYLPENKKQPEEMPEDSRILLFRKEGSEVTVSLAALGKKGVRVHLVEVGSVN